MPLFTKVDNSGILVTEVYAMANAALRLRDLVGQLLGVPLPVRIRAWDGSEAGPPDAPALVVRNRRAVRRLLFKPGELGLARAWVTGDLDIDGDLYTALGLISGLVWERGEDARTLSQALRDPEVRSAVRGLVALAGPPLPPAPPPEEIRRARGHLHTRRSDKRAISHHYDVGNGFYEIVLGPSMVYSCAYW
jgi:cyclopropane-fatty-acyl-phospholipid synthase